MSMKEMLERYQPFQLYIVLVISIAYFAVQLFFSHVTHALTLLVDSYHMLCNIIALSGCIITVKRSNPNSNTAQQEITQNDDNNKIAEIPLKHASAHGHSYSNPNNNERTLLNTFGWTRIDVLTMLIVCVFLASLCFSLLVEALQTLIHIDHQDTMHLPIPVLIVGIFGLLLNALCYYLIGGYTYHQGSFLHLTSAGNVVLESVVSTESIQNGVRPLTNSKSDNLSSSNIKLFCGHKSRESLMELCRDTCSTIFVILCAIIIYFSDENNVSKFIDPVLSIVSCILLLSLSIPYLKESCMILLQTIPQSIDIDVFTKELLKSFESIINVHDLHIWRLTATKAVATAHITFENPKDYHITMDAVVDFFHQKGITIVTIQPEFIKDEHISEKKDSSKCLVACQKSDCMDKYCCYENVHPKTLSNRTSSLPNQISSTSDNSLHKRPNKDSVASTGCLPNKSFDQSIEIFKARKDKAYLPRGTYRLHNSNPQISTISIGISENSLFSQSDEKHINSKEENFNKYKTKRSVERNEVLQVSNNLK